MLSINWCVSVVCTCFLSCVRATLTESREKPFGSEKSGLLGNTWGENHFGSNKALWARLFRDKGLHLKWDSAKGCVGRGGHHCMQCRQCELLRSMLPLISGRHSSPISHLTIPGSLRLNLLIGSNAPYSQMENNWYFFFFKFFNSFPTAESNISCSELSLSPLARTFAVSQQYLLIV